MIGTALLWATVWPRTVLWISVVIRSMIIRLLVWVFMIVRLIVGVKRRVAWFRPRTFSMLELIRSVILVFIVMLAWMVGVILVELIFVDMILMVYIIMQRLSGQIVVVMVNWLS
jgi:hypothetical protein